MRTIAERLECLTRELEEERLNLEGVTAKITNIQLEICDIAKEVQLQDEQNTSH